MNLRRLTFEEDKLTCGSDFPRTPTHQNTRTDIMTTENRMFMTPHDTLEIERSLQVYSAYRASGGERSSLQRVWPAEER